jgi:hypothetical protein
MTGKYTDRLKAWLDGEISDDAFYKMIAEADAEIEALQKDRDEWRKKYRDLAIVDDREALAQENAELRESWGNARQVAIRAEAERDALKKALIDLHANPTNPKVGLAASRVIANCGGKVEVSDD